MSDNLRALNRFGLGARVGESARLHDGREWLRAQLEGGAPTLPPPPGTSPAELGALLRDAMAPGQRRSPEERQAARQRLIRFGAAESRAALEQRVASDRPFVERLVAFWSNHLCVSAAGKLPVVPLAGSYEREAIRPHVLGRFDEMVLASAKHPAMLLYLDNARSIGPDSPGARQAVRRGGAQRGLNENYARELLELHTLGVDGGYTQRDVIELARLLTGWTVAGVGGPGVGGRMVGSGDAPGFAFREALHEPGSKTVLNVRYGSGVAQGERAIRSLCRHPSTARFVATKLVRHFVTDDPPSAAVDRLARVFHESEGDLRAVSAALIELPEAWSAETRKFRTPQEWLIAVLRALEAPRAGDAVLHALRQLRHPLWAPQAPKGFGDTVQEWADPDSLHNRAELARSLARRVAGRDTDPRRLLEVVDVPAGDPLRALLADRTIAADERLALALASPAFQWR